MEGNQMKMREALENLTRFAEVDIRGLENLAKYAIDHSMYGGGVLRAVAGAIREGKNALSAPARNCDVGTAEEQSVRMSEFCREQYKKTDGVALCSGCRFRYIEGVECQFAWAQMPYEEGGAK